MLVTATAATLLVVSIMYEQRTRTIEGTWVDLFEGSRFFEDQDLSKACSPGFMGAAWFEPPLNPAEAEVVRRNRASGVFISKYGSWPVAAYSVKFVGHHEFVGLGFGHMSGSPSEFVAERILSIRPIPQPRCDIRPD